MPSAASRSKSIPPAGLESRLLALSLLRMVLHKQRTVEQAWETAEEPLRAFEASDAGFVRTLMLAVLRHLGQIDAILVPMIEKPLPANAGAVQDILRLGIAQLLWLGTPPHAAVHSAVEMTRARNLPNFAGMVNAILQKVSREAENWRAQADAHPAMNLPTWLRARLEAAYGRERMEAILRAQMAFGTETPVMTDLTFCDPAAVEAALPLLPEGAVALPNGSVRVPDGGRPEQWHGYAEGLWWVQDAAASMPAKLLLSALPASPGRLLDACAAPGGKTAQLAAAGHAVAALDLSASRLRRLTENLDRLQLTAELVTGDAGSWRPEQPYDAVLLDAPCSATGTVRRHPELPWQRSAADLVRLTQLQTRMLDQCAFWLKPGGVLLYAVCSLLPEEGEEAIAALRARCPAFQPLPFGESELAACGVTQQACHAAPGTLRLVPTDWPEAGGMDGFFIGRLRYLPR